MARVCHPLENAAIGSRRNMNRLSVILQFLTIAFCLVTIGGAGCTDTAEPASRSVIPRVRQMADLPQPFAMRDWSQVTRDYLDLVLDFDQHGDRLPLVQWIDESHTTVSIPAYVGGPPQPEAINYLAAVVSGSLVGLDMRTFRDHDWVALGKQFFNAEEGAYVNRLGGRTGKSFWYDLFPNVLFYQITALYPDDVTCEQQARAVAESWCNATEALCGKAEGSRLPNFEHTGFSLATRQTMEQGWIEPDAAAGTAWLEYMAWVKFHDERFLSAADLAIRSLEARPAEKSPLYEVLLPYGALAAARMNAELGRDYDVARLVNACFEPCDRQGARPGWGVLLDRWNDPGSQGLDAQRLDVQGLVGSTTDGGGYAFAMNTFEWAGALVPLARYDTRYAHDIGKWTLNLANAARLFYPNAFDALHQSSLDWATAHDGKSVIAYEGIRKWKRGATTATADYRTSSGNILQGSFASTTFRGESPPDCEIFEESSGNAIPFTQIWEFDLPVASARWLVVDAERIDGGHAENFFRFSFASTPDGPYTPAFSVSGAKSAQVVKLPANLHGKLYLKAESSNQPTDANQRDTLSVDAMAISYQSDVGPFAQGDQVVTFIDLLNEATVPIVLYRPESAATDLGLYGSSHAGILGGIIRETNIEGILQLDLLKTDYFHAAAYPSFLYYNPHTLLEKVEIDVGPEPLDIYDAVNGQFIQRSVHDLVSIAIPADSATIAVLTPAGGKVRREGKRTLVNDVVVRYAD
jgi:hypothetical protein